MAFNGPPRELNGSHLDDLVYCVTCGNSFVYADGRDCPTCTLAEMIDELDESTLACIERIEARLDAPELELTKPVADRGGPDRDI